MLVLFRSSYSWPSLRSFSHRPMSSSHVYARSLSLSLSLVCALNKVRCTHCEKSHNIIHKKICIPYAACAGRSGGGVRVTVSSKNNWDLAHWKSPQRPTLRFQVFVCVEYPSNPKQHIPAPSPPGNVPLCYHRKNCSLQLPSTSGTQDV